MNDKLDLKRRASDVYETAKEMSSSENPPDDTTWKIAENILQEAQRILPEDSHIQKVELTSKLWVSLRSAMAEVVNGLQAAYDVEQRASRGGSGTPGVWS